MKNKEENCNHIYSRGLGEPRPRLCEHCKKPEVCQACHGDGDIHMCCIVCTGADNGDMKSEHTCTEFRPSPLELMYKMHIAKDEIVTVIRNSSLTKWDWRWVDRANYVSEYSKDKNTKTGAVIVDDDNTELVMGYNGFPRGADDEREMHYSKQLERE